MTEEYSKEELFQQHSLKLIQATKAGKLEEVKSLLAKQINPNVKDDQQCTALMYGAMSGNLEIVKLLVEAKADINAERFNSSSVLMLAVEKGYLEIVELLLENRVDFTWLNQYRECALSIAASKGNSRIIKQLLDAKTDKDRGVELDIALSQAAGFNQGVAIKMLLAAGANINGARANIFYPALSNAAMHGSLRATELLISLGADVNFRNEQGQTPLMIAADFGQEKIVEMLIKAGADVNAQDNKGKTVIKFAHFPDVKELLINAGAKGRRSPKRKSKLPD